MTASPCRPRRVTAFAATGFSLIAAGVLAAGAPASLAAGTGRSGTEQPTAAANPATTAATPVLGKIGSYPLGQEQLIFTEPPHTGPTGIHLPARSLVTFVRYPRVSSISTTKQFPLVLFAPGYLQCGAPYTPLLQAIASAGYVVVVVNFPRNDCNARANPYEPDLVNEPQDMSYVITQMLKLSAASTGVLSGLINPAKIGAAGHSDGGDVVALLAANSCCTDKRVSAIAVFSGAEWLPPPGAYYPAAPAPMLFVQGNKDTINPPFYSQQLYNLDPSLDRYYLDLLGADHTLPYWSANPVEQRTALITTLFFDRWLLSQWTGPAMAQNGNAGGKAIFVNGKKLAPKN